MDVPQLHPIHRRRGMSNANSSSAHIRAPSQPHPVTPRTIPRSYPSWSPTLFATPLRRAAGIRESERSRDTGHSSVRMNLDSDRMLSFQADNEHGSFQQWTTNHIEWCCRDLSEIMGDSTETPLHERSALLGKVIPESRFRLDVVLNTQPTISLDQQADLLARLNLDDRAALPQAEMNAFKPHFSVYVAPAFTSYGEHQGESRKTADIFLGIKPNNVPAGPGEGQDRWLWSKSDSYVFAEDSEFWGKFHVARSVRLALTVESFVAEASLPPIADLLSNPAIQEQDCFTLVLRLQTPATYASALNGVEKRLVDRNLLLGLESLLDDVNTGDIRLVCLEREEGSSPPSSRDPSLLSTAEQSSRNSRYRKRVLYAHTSIIKHRSEYLDDWIRFSSSAEQGSSSRNNSTWLDRATHSVTCLDVDFVTMYWFLHFLYTGELEFKNDEDVTNTPAFYIESLDPDVAQKLASDSAECSSWEWRSLASVDGTVNVGFDENETPAGKRPSSRPSVSTSPQQVVLSASASNTVAHGKTSRTPTEGRFTSKINETSSRTPRPSSVSSHATLQVASQLARTLSSPTTSKQATTTRAPPTMDPHDHPTGPLAPASAFAIYALAHRYQLDELARLAQNHLLARLKPASACSLLLASFRFQTLHSAVEDYVISHWEEVQYSPEFLRVIQDIASGSWGSDGGSCLHSLFGRFHSSVPAKDYEWDFVATEV